jgi:hypothetical protein
VIAAIVIGQWHRSGESDGWGEMMETQSFYFPIVQVIRALPLSLSACNGLHIGPSAFGLRRPVLRVLIPFNAP